MRKPIYVTRPALPPLEEYTELLEQIWDKRILTNNGPMHKQLEEELASYLGVNYVSLFANGTLAQITALQALRISGEVITTPYSFVASTHSLWWNNIKPVFSDIEGAYCNLDPEKIEAAITPHTTAIMPVHVYGNPCSVERIRDIANVYGLKVIYDACHTFDVRINGEPVLNYGDLSVMSFHATKVFNTFEGGAIICHDEHMKKRIDFLKNFGFAGETTVVAHGINAKMNEMQAALGLLQLKRIKENIEKRRQVCEQYRERLTGTGGVSFLSDIEGVQHCYSYFPVFIDASLYGMSRNDLYDKLKEQGIYGRRYFYPLISQFPAYRGHESALPGKLPVAEKKTEQVICLPLYPELEPEAVDHICSIISKNRRQ
ncbi:MAG: DegT/DnrJ/EryC1/StrS family aminotransferase [Bacteroidales bacterium]|nr:DegT/DnrJ/EryC1/StrS family aminotransferase [Bacteroidales bacterium]